MPENVNTSSLAAAVEDLSEDNRRTMVKVDHVSMIFNMASEQLNSLKEYAIQIARRKLFFEGFTALDDVSFEVKKGDVFGIIGTNGSGKSTMLNMIAGVYPIDSGKIEIDGVNISRQPEYKRAKYIGRVFQDPMKGTAAGMEIQENMALAFRRGQKRGLGWGIRANEKDYYHDLLTRLGLGLQNRMSSKVGLLSGGQRQALTLLMATLQKPKLLLLDEHTAALDPQTARKVLDLTNEMVTEQNLTALMVTHNMKDAIQIGNRLIMMNDGRIIYDVSGREKQNLTVEDLLAKFAEASGGQFANDRMLLSK